MAKKIVPRVSSFQKHPPKTKGWPYRFSPGEMDGFAGEIWLRAVEGRLWDNHKDESRKPQYLECSKGLCDLGSDPAEARLVAAEQTGFLPPSEVGAIRLIHKLRLSGPGLPLWQQAMSRVVAKVSTRLVQEDVEATQKQGNPKAFTGSIDEALERPAA